MSFKKEFAEIEFQKSGFCDGSPYRAIKSCLHLPRLEVEVGWGVVVTLLLQRSTKSGYEPTTPAQITPALISLDTTILRRVIYPPIECPHIPILSGSESE